MLITLWIMAILTIFALGIGFRTSLELRLARYQMDKIRALYITKAAMVEVKEYMAIDLSSSSSKDYDSLYLCGINLLTEDTPEKLFKDIAVGDGYYSVKYKIGVNQDNQTTWRYGLSDEERKININKADGLTLWHLFSLLGIEPAKCDTISASIVDWRDADSAPVNPYGAENDYYQNLEHAYNCKNADFETLGELLLVKDMNQEIFSKIKDCLTIFGDGKVNINSASSIVLQALASKAGLADDAQAFANNIIDYRSGNDKIDGTADDNPCVNPGGIAPYIQSAFPGVSVTEVSNNLAAKSTNFRAEIQAVSSDNKVIKNTAVILDTSGAVKFYQEE